MLLYQQGGFSINPGARGRPGLVQHTLLIGEVTRIMDVVNTTLPGVKIIRPKRFGDARGYFSETFNRRAFGDRVSGAIDFVQDNVAYSAQPGTVRGLHFQAPPFAQDKLVSAFRGKILDVAVDIRRGSPTYGQHVAIVLDAAQGDQVFIPAGFAHGYCTMEADCLVFYKVSNFYAPQAEAGLAWNDPTLGIAWPVDPGEAELSAKDRTWPRLCDLRSPFEFG